jgi:hypothetical protein
VDWRTIVLLSQLKTVKTDIDLAVSHAQGLDRRELRRLYDIVPETAACKTNQTYRLMRTSSPLSRAADIDMTLFGLSLAAWRL